MGYKRSGVIALLECYEKKGAPIQDVNDAFDLINENSDGS
jgi:hypothetical protein